MAASAESPAPRSLALIGLPASGKSTVARVLAGRLGLPVLDLDEEVAAEAGRDIPGIFEAEGEAGFRDLESRALRRASEGDPCVLATGGGIVVRPENRELLRTRFRTVWLRVAPETAAARSAGGARPLLAGGDPEARIRDLYERRAALYAECAIFSVDTEGRSPEAVVEDILEQIR